MPPVTRRRATDSVAETITTAADLGFDYLIKWSAKRRTLSLEVHAGQVIARAPNAMRRVDIQAFVASRRNWITAKLGQQLQRQEEIPERDYSDGAEFPWLGEHYRLQVSRGSHTHIQLLSNTIDVRLAPRTQLTTQLQQWYYRQAQQLLIDKTHFFAEELGVTVSSVSFRQTKSKWGHCTRSGEIQYNWMIALAPEAIVDYLVVHEVSHRRHFNHSPDFWATVASLHPDYKMSREWLKRYGHTLKL